MPSKCVKSAPTNRVNLQFVRNPFLRDVLLFYSFEITPEFWVIVVVIGVFNLAVIEKEFTGCSAYLKEGMGSCFTVNAKGAL